MSEHCTKCCKTDRGTRLVAAVILLGLIYWALSYLVPANWSVGQRVAATFLFMGLSRDY